MRVFLRRVLAGRWALTERRGICYRTAARAPLQPWQVRQRRFSLTGFGRRGLDPTEVREFLDLVAGELAAAHEALNHSRDEVKRTKDVLRRWQAQQVRQSTERGH